MSLLTCLVTTFFNVFRLDVLPYGGNFPFQFKKNFNFFTNPVHAQDVLPLQKKRFGIERDILGQGRPLAFFCPIWV